MSKSTKQLLVAIPVIFLFIAIAVPNFIKPRGYMAMTACANNLRNIEIAKGQWALEKQKTTNDVPTMDDLRPWLPPNDVSLHCPIGGIYTIGRIGEPVKCSIGGADHTLRPD